MTPAVSALIKTAANVFGATIGAIIVSYILPNSDPIDTMLFGLVLVALYNLHFLAETRNP